MDAFEETLQKAKEVVEVAYKKTGEVIALQKQKLDVATLESKLSKDYEKLGRIQFVKLKEAEIEEQDLAALVSAIKDRLSKIEELRAEIQKAQGKIVCPSCGTTLSADSVFCKVCGEKLGEE